MSINSSHLLGFGRPRASGRPNLSYLTCLEAQHVDKIITFALLWEATGGSVCGGPVVNNWFGMLQCFFSCSPALMLSLSRALVLSCCYPFAGYIVSIDEL